jgi:hypothetical protein
MLSDLRKEDRRDIKILTLMRMGLIEFRAGSFRWIKFDSDSFFYGIKNIHRRSYHLFATLKILGEAYRLTRSVWSVYFRSLIKVWLRGQPESQKEINQLIKDRLN